MAAEDHAAVFDSSPGIRPRADNSADGVNQRLTAVHRRGWRFFAGSESRAVSPSDVACRSQCRFALSLKVPSAGRPRGGINHDAHPLRAVLSPRFRDVARTSSLASPSLGIVVQVRYRDGRGPRRARTPANREVSSSQFSNSSMAPGEQATGRDQPLHRQRRRGSLETRPERAGGTVAAGSRLGIAARSMAMIGVEMIDTGCPGFRRTLVDAYSHVPREPRRKQTVRRRK